MKVVYREPDIYEKFESAREEAKETGQIIDHFVITVEEFEQFIDMAADLDSKSLFAGYSILTKHDGTKEYFYKSIPVIVTPYKEYD